jgi:bifunctional enzyme CysN/CysC
MVSEHSHDVEVLRFATAGSVDDGKSSLIGRLLYDSKSIYEDQLQAVERASRARGSEQVELALLTDGLRAEREQNITIDVAYRYFSTPRRKFIVADTPGHVQYTRNMATGASTADLAVILVDARKGVLPQSKRHAAISSLFGIRHLVVAVNKMDLVDFSQARFDEIVTEFSLATVSLGIEQRWFIPISALLGDNVVDRSANMPWYTGSALLELLETIPIPTPPIGSFRLPIQSVVRPNQDHRGFAGQVEDGTIRVGDAVVALPSRQQTVVRSIRLPDGPADQATVGDPVVLELQHEIDLGRGALLAGADAAPTATDRVEGIVCWFADTPARSGLRYLMQHGTSRLPVLIDSIEALVDVETLNEGPAAELNTNDLGRIRIHTSAPIYIDLYRQNRATGAFTLIDPNSFRTVAAGIVIAKDAEPGVRRSEPGMVIAVSGQNADFLAGKLAQRLRPLRRGTVVLTEEDAPGTLNALSLRIAAQGLNVIASTQRAGETRIRLDGREIDVTRGTVDETVEALYDLIFPDEFVI